MKTWQLDGDAFNGHLTDISWSGRWLQPRLLLYFAVGLDTLRHS